MISEAKKQKIDVHHREIDTQRWALVDFYDVAFNVFLEDARAFYNLENLWEEAERVVL